MQRETVAILYLALVVSCAQAQVLAPGKPAGIQAAQHISYCTGFIGLSVIAVALFAIGDAAVGALLHHMYEEEGNWFLDLKQKSSPRDREMMTARYAEEFDRYVGDIGVELEDDDEIED